MAAPKVVQLRVAARLLEENVVDILEGLLKQAWGLLGGGIRREIRAEGTA